MRTSGDSAPKYSSGRQRRTANEVSRHLPLLRSLIQNLIAYLYDRSEYLRSVRDYMTYQVEYRSGRWMGGTAFLGLAMVFFAGASFSMMFSLYQLLLNYTQNAALAAFIVSWASVFVGFLFLRFSRSNYRALARGITYREWKNREDHRGK